MASKSKVSKVASKTGGKGKRSKVASGPGKVASKKTTLPAARERERKTAPRRRAKDQPPTPVPAVPAVPAPAAPAASEHGAVPHGLDQHISEPGGGAGENAPSMQPPPEQPAEEPAPVQDPSPVSNT